MTTYEDEHDTYYDDCSAAPTHPRRHPQTSDVPRADGYDGDEPPELMLVCSSDECGAEEPAPVGMAPGETTDCAYCGEVAEVEIR